LEPSVGELSFWDIIGFPRKRFTIQLLLKCDTTVVAYLAVTGVGGNIRFVVVVVVVVMVM